MSPLRPCTPLDALLIGCLLLAGAVGLWLTGRPAAEAGGAGRWARVEVDGREVARLSLDRPGERWVRGRYGEVLLEVQQRRIRVKDEKPLCPRRICLATGWVGQTGRPIICVPNHLVVRVEGRGEGSGGAGEAGYDALAW